MAGTSLAMTWSGDRDAPVSLDRPPPASPRSQMITATPLKQDIVVLDRVARIG